MRKRLYHHQESRRGEAAAQAGRDDCTGPTPNRDLPAPGVKVRQFRVCPNRNRFDSTLESYRNVALFVPAAGVTAGGTREATYAAMATMSS
jgi:hypothetical protein